MSKTDLYLTRGDCVVRARAYLAPFRAAQVLERQERLPFRLPVVGARRHGDALAS